MKETHLTWSEINLDTMRGLFFSSFTGAPLAAEVVSGANAQPVVGQLTIGHQAVMVFFVLSGYLVGGSVLNSFATEQWRWSSYLVKRLVRLWIVLIPAIFIGVLIDNIGFTFFAEAGGIYSAPFGQQYVTPNDVMRSFDVWIIIGNWLFVQGIFVPTAGTNLALWSLSNEFWYYLMFPMFLLAFQRNATMTRRIIFGLGVVGIGALIGAHAAFLFLVWGLGAIVAWLPRRIPSRLAGLVVILGTFVFVGIFLMLKKFNFPLYVSEMTLGTLTALLVYAIKCQSGPGKLSSYSRLSQFFSNISYTLYLTHLPFLIFVCAIVNSPWTLWAMSPLSLALFLVLMSLAIGWAWLLYLLFESKTDEARRVVWSGVSKFVERKSLQSSSQGGSRFWRQDF